MPTKMRNQHAGLAQADLSAQPATAERASHASQNPLLLVRRHVLSGELLLHIGNDLGVKGIGTAARTGGPGSQVLPGERLRRLFERKRACRWRSCDSQSEACTAQSDC